MADTNLWARDLTPGWTDLYFRVWDDAGNIWQTTTSTYVAMVVADLANYRLVATESPAGSGRYVVAFPGGAPKSYTWAAYKGAGAVADPRWAGPASGYWDGTTFGNVPAVNGPVGSVTGAVGSVAGNVGGNVVGSVASVVGGVGGNVVGSVGSVVGNVGGTVASVVGAVGSVAGNVAGSVASVAPGGINSASFAAGATLPRVTLADTLTTYTGNVPQTGDSYTRIGTGGVNLTALAVAGAAMSLTPAERNTVAAAVRDVNNSTPAGGSLGAKINSAAVAGGDPLALAVPGSYLPGTAGYRLGTYLDATVSSRLATAGYVVPPTPPTVTQIRTELDNNSVKLAYLDATVSSRSTYAGADTPGTGTLLSRLTAGRATALDNLDAAISTRYAGGDTPGVTTLLARLTGTRAANLDLLDVNVSTRSTYAGGDTAGVTTLLGRLTAPRATALDYLDAAVSTRSTYAGADTAGTTTLLGRLTAGRATNLDNLNASVAAVSTKVDTVQTTVSGGNLPDIQAAIDAIAARQTTYDQLTPLATVNDPAPTTGAVTIELDTALPDTFVWRGGEAWFTWFNGSGLLSGGKFPITSFSRLSATTARITFSPLLPAVPANGDRLQLV